MIRTFILSASVALGAPALAQDAAPAPAPATDGITVAVAADWPKYDQGGKGHLTQAEFGTWLTALKAQQGSKDDPAKVKAWADGQFASADANANAQVTPEELTRFLQSKTKK